jgi:hypothetical protein
MTEPNSIAIQQYRTLRYRALRNQAPPLPHAVYTHAESGIWQIATRITTTTHPDGARHAKADPALAELKLHLAMLVGAEYFRPHQHPRLHTIKRWLTGQRTQLSRKEPITHIRQTGDVLLGIAAYALGYTDTSEMVDHIACAQKQQRGVNDQVMAPYHRPVSHLPRYVNVRGTEDPMVAMVRALRFEQAVRDNKRFEWASDVLLPGIHAYFPKRHGVAINAAIALEALSAFTGKTHHPRLQHTIALLFNQPTIKGWPHAAKPCEIFVEHNPKDRSMAPDRASAASIARRQRRQIPKR